jgi:hypothetical protein
VQDRLAGEFAVEEVARDGADRRPGGLARDRRGQPPVGDQAGEQAEVRPGGTPRDFLEDDQAVKGYAADREEPAQIERDLGSRRRAEVDRRDE